MKLLSEFTWEPSRKYRAVTTCDIVLDLGMGYVGSHEFRTKDNRLLGILNDDRLTIFAGYASDLCSPGWYFLGRWYGTPSKGMELEAILHDFARQVMDTPCCPWDRHGSDDLFYNCGKMRGHGMKIDLYHGAVAGPVGSLWIWLNRPRHDIFCSVCENQKASHENNPLPPILPRHPELHTQRLSGRFKISVC